MSDKTEEFRILSEWGQRLETYRPKDNNGEPITQNAWSEQIGVASTNLGDYLRGKASPRLFMMQKIQKHLLDRGFNDHHWAWLTSGEGPRPPESEEDFKRHTRIKRARNWRSKRVGALVCAGMAADSLYHGLDAFI